MEQNFYTQLQFIRKFGDYIIINVSFFIGYVLKFGFDFEIFATNNYLSFLLFFNLAWIISTSALKSYKTTGLNLSFLNMVDGVVRLILLHLLLVAAFNGLIKTYFSRLFILYTYISMTLLIFLWRYLSLRILVWEYHKNKRVNKIILLGVNISIKDMEDYFSFFYKHKLLEVQKIDHKTLDTEELLAPETLINKIKEQNFSELFLSVSNLGDSAIQAIIDYAEANLKRVHLVIDDPFLNSRHLELARYNETPVINIRLSPLDYFSNQLIKRTFDIVFSLFVIIFILTWLYPLMAILIKMSSKGPVLFKQLRSGLNNEPFVCFKFRTMRENDQADLVQASGNDPRITPIGGFMRRTSIDELPQFFNVLAGEMSVVGPRPHMLKHTEEYTKEVGKFLKRHAIKPGITGLAQAKGYRGEIKNLNLLKGRVRLDWFYVENWSLNLDIKIIFMTLRSIFGNHL
jgi:Undecaprenyl-phosphate glucose phosphotransferase